MFKFRVLTLPILIACMAIGTLLLHAEFSGVSEDALRQSREANIVQQRVESVPVQQAVETVLIADRMSGASAELLDPAKQIRLATLDPHDTHDSTPFAAYTSADDWLQLGDSTANRNPAGYPQVEGTFDIKPGYERGSRVTLPLPGLESISGTVITSTSDNTGAALGIDLDGSDGIAHFDFNADGSIARGLILSQKSSLAYAISPTEGEKIIVRAAPKDEFIPDEPPGITEQAAASIGAGDEFEGTNGESFEALDAVPILESLPGAPGVILLDFDGHTVSGTYWNTFYTNGADIVAPDLNWSESKIYDTWLRVAEDFRPFTVNVTTSEAVYQSTPGNQKIRVVFSSYSSWMGNYGGVAYYNSWSWTNDTPAWVFTSNLANNSRYAAEAASHEVGHTLNLQHDGRTSPSEGYFRGHGDWAPIMGVGYYEGVTQWSKGEYQYANNLQDDLVTMRTFAGVAYRADLHGNSIATASALNVIGTSIVDSGVIEQGNDLDVFSFQTGAGNISISVQSTIAGTHGNLNVKAELLNAAGQIVATSDSTSTINAVFSNLAVTAGQYFLRIDGVGELDPATTGYSDYGSLGEYHISGTLVSSGQPTPTPSATPSATPTPTDTNTATPTPQPTATPQPTPTPEPSTTPTATPTQSPQPSPSSTPQPSPSTTPEPTPSEPPQESDYLNFHTTPPTRFGGRRYTGKHTLSVSSDGYSLSLSGTTWQQVDFPLVVTKSTVLELTLTPAEAGRIIALGFESDERPDESNFFQLAGTQRWGNQDFNDGCGSGCQQARAIRLPVGRYLHDIQINRLVFVSDRGAATFSMIRTFEEEAPENGQVPFRHSSISTYGGAAQDETYESEIYDSNETLMLGNNSWKKLYFPYSITENTVLSLRFTGEAGAEIQGIGVDDNTIISPESIFQLGGSQQFGVLDFFGAQGLLEIPIGQYLSGDISFLVFVNDNDTGSSDARAFFESVRIFERGESVGSSSLQNSCGISMRKKRRSRFRASISLPETTPAVPYSIEATEDMGETWEALQDGTTPDRSQFRTRLRIRRARKKVFRLVVPGVCSEEFYQSDYEVSLKKRSRQRRR